MKKESEKTLEEYQKEEKEVLDFIKEKLGMKNIDNLIILVDGDIENTVGKCWNWRLRGDFRSIITLLETFKLNLLTGKLSKDKVVDASNFTTKDTENTN